MIAWAHGTTGTAQSCGPSQMLDPAKSLNQYFLVGGDSWTDYGLPSVETFIKEGYVVVGTDYQGLGSGGRHQYSVAVTNGRDVINSVRAAGSMKETGGGRKAVVYGWSQGGGAALGGASLTDYIAPQGHRPGRGRVPGLRGNGARRCRRRRTEGEADRDDCREDVRAACHHLLGQCL
jgi:hypothetical protein